MRGVACTRRPARAGRLASLGRRRSRPAIPVEAAWRSSAHGRQGQLETGDLEPATRKRLLRLQAERARRRRWTALAALAFVVALTLVVAGARALRHHHGDASTDSAGAPADAGPTPTESQREQQAIDRVLSYTPFIREGSRRKREVALTFDDGPGPYTPQILDVLRHHHAKATFFEVGTMLTSFSDSTVKQTHRGYAIGNHTFSHPHMGALPKGEQGKQLNSTSAALKHYTHANTRLFRPPFGSFDRDTLELLRKRRALMVLWSTDTEDYLDPGAEVIAARALEGAHPGAIILLHDAGGDRSQTVAALPAIIRGLRERHLRPVTIPRLLLDDPPPRGQKVPWDLAGGS